MPRFAANLSFLFTELPFPERFAAAADQGFKACEFMFPYEWAAKDLHELLQASQLALVLFNAAQGDWDAGDRGIAAIAGREDAFDAAIEEAIGYAGVLGNSLIHVMAGLDGHGAERAAFVGNLRRAADRVAGDDITLVIEPINTRDMPGYFLSHTQQALDILAEVDRPNVGLQFDFYHRAVMDGDVEAGFKETLASIRHIQIASPPDRGEPDKGEVDYAHVLKMIDASGYEGYVGLEYKPRAGTVPGLKWAETLNMTFG